MEHWGVYASFAVSLRKAIISNSHLLKHGNCYAKVITEGLKEMVKYYLGLHDCIAFSTNWFDHWHYMNYTISSVQKVKKELLYPRCTNSV